MTTTITASKDPLLVALRCANTGLWKLILDYKVLGHEYPKQFIAGVDVANAICGSGISNKRDISQRSTRRQLCNVAGSDDDTCLEILSGLGKNTKRSYERPTKRHTINKD